ncbi:methyltransferase domain-containing protein [Paenibacillus mesophilus]|uniref:methyltransferase domain-containing protein n=1 Tax=Paenibacillus mesophilus TaxID=2582849 RepID=UPI00110EE7BE|nr:methyltransferase domain-containing protein [Paenibacillus mesophilus]TMV50325.1 methyltransferase domain-containing protein [Paenibacillus mesophilus]
MKSKAEAFSKSIDPYLNYTKMPWGKLFYLSAWNQIDEHLSASSQSILDIGCGFGLSSLEYAGRGNEVTGIDPTPEIIEIAKESADREGLSVRFAAAAFQSALHLVERYDWIFCHNVLEYVENPVEFIEKISACQGAGGHLSIIAHNPTAKVMKKAIVNKNPEEALASIGSTQEYSGIIQTDITIYTRDQLEAWLEQYGYEVIGTYGIHNLYGYITDNEVKMDDTWNNQIIKLEMELGKLHPYKDIAIFSHLIARKR